MPEEFDPTLGVIEKPSTEPEVRPGEEPAITVDLDKPPAAPAPKPGEDTAIQLQELRKQNEQLRNQIRASYRVTERIERQMEELRRGVVPAKPVTPAQTPADSETQRIEELKPWEKPLRSWAKEEAQRLFDEKEAQRQLDEYKKNRNAELERSQQFVLEKYPDLYKPESEIAEAYDSIVNAHPEWHKDPFGPVRIMLEMERIALEEGIQLPNSSPKQPAPKSNMEVARRSRASASLPPGRSIPAGTKVTLSKEQQDFAARHRIPVETYAKMVSGLSQNGGVEAP